MRSFSFRGLLTLLCVSALSLILSAPALADAWIPEPKSAAPGAGVLVLAAAVVIAAVVLAVILYKKKR